jgi:hypothetical protein
MTKSLKKIAAFLSMFAMAFVLFLPMQAKADEERTALFVQVPDDWENPCVWAWDEDGNNAFDAWPGGEAEADTANEGWYYIYIPAWANHVIVNANEGNVQTGEILLEGGNAWITVEDADNASVSYEALTQGDIPEYVEKFIIHASVPESWESPCLWAWSAPDGTNAFDAWPGAPFKADGNGGYTAKAPVWVNSIIINANDGSVQTEDISIDPAELWITVADDGSYEFTYDDPNAVSAPDIHVNVIAPADWSAPCLWAWSAPDGTNAFASWPGEPFAEGEDGWLTLTVPGWINSIIVNGNEGSVQTSDISVETGKDIWLVVTGAEEYELSYEKPDGVTGPADTAPADTPDADSDGGQDAGTDPDNSADQTPDADTDAAGNAGAGQSTDPADSDSSKTGLSGGLIALIVAACAVVLAVIAGVVVKLKKKGNKS